MFVRNVLLSEKDIPQDFHVVAAIRYMYSVLAQCRVIGRRVLEKHSESYPYHIFFFTQIPGTS